jgi:hypothetical protein
MLTKYIDLAEINQKCDRRYRLLCDKVCKFMLYTNFLN